MSYTLYTDKNEQFECKLNLTGASLKNSFVKMLVEGKETNLFFKGKIDENGTCNIDIRKLKGLLNENETGKMVLEVVADDTYFCAWEDDFKVETEKKVTVEVMNKQTTKPIISNKPKLTVENIKPQPKAKVVTKPKPKKVVNEHVDRIYRVLKKNKITFTNKNKNLITEFIYDYNKQFKLNKLYNKEIVKYLAEHLK